MQLKEAIQICLTYLGDEDAGDKFADGSTPQVEAACQMRQPCDKGDSRRVSAPYRGRGRRRKRRQIQF